MNETITTEDGYILAQGCKAFNYYDMKPGTIQFDLDDQGWFTFKHWDGTSTILNGERICTLKFASHKGWYKDDSLSEVVENKCNE